VHVRVGVVAVGAIGDICGRLRARLRRHVRVAVAVAVGVPVVGREALVRVLADYRPARADRRALVAGAARDVATRVALVGGAVAVVVNAVAHLWRARVHDRVGIVAVGVIGDISGRLRARLRRHVRVAVAVAVGVPIVGRKALVRVLANYRPARADRRALIAGAACGIRHITCVPTICKT